MLKKIASICTLIALVVACSSSSSSGGGVTDNYDRGVLLTNLTNNIIIPSLENLQSKQTTLQAAVAGFIGAPNDANLTSTRTAFVEAYKAWQHVEMFNFAKATEVNFMGKMNIYPLNTTEVENNIANGGYDLNNNNNLDAQGFPALDYLLYGLAADDTAILAKYTTDANADKYKQYLNDLVIQMTSLINTVLGDWNGTYKATFIADTGNEKTSSLNIFLNAYVAYYEAGLRKNKFGTPGGAFSGGTKFPEKVEAFYNKNLAKTLALEALAAFEGVFTGKHFNTTTQGEGIKSYLTYLEELTIISDIEGQLTSAKTEINKLNEDFSEEVTNNNDQILKVYDELQKAVSKLKIDMMQAFKVTVDYQDNDGD